MTASRSEAGAMDPEKRAQELAATADPLRWFETLYAEAAGSLDRIPWALGRAEPLLESWLETARGREVVEDGGRALVVGCGPGDDAELLARQGLRTTAFDHAPSAIALARSRFPESRVTYEEANLLNPPAEWTGRFDFVLEAFTLQSLPESLRALALPALGRFLAPGGSLLILTRGRCAQEPISGFPMPLARAELEPLIAVRAAGPPRLWLSSFEDLLGDEAPGERWLRVELRRGSERDRRRATEDPR